MRAPRRMPWSPSLWRPATLNRKPNRRVGKSHKFCGGCHHPLVVGRRIRVCSALAIHLQAGHGRFKSAIIGSGGKPGKLSCPAVSFRLGHAPKRPPLSWWCDFHELEISIQKRSNESRKPARGRCLARAATSSLAGCRHRISTRPRTTSATFWPMGLHCRGRPGPSFLAVISVVTTGTRNPSDPRHGNRLSASRAAESLGF
jgi:hypothetical protein